MDSTLQGKIFRIVPPIFSCPPSNMGTNFKFLHQKSKHTFVVLFLTNWKILERFCSFEVSIQLLEMRHQSDTFT